MIFEIGDIVRIKKEYESKVWYHNTNMKIVSICDAANVYVVYKGMKGQFEFKKDFFADLIGMCYLVKNMRKKKLERILK